MIEEGYIRPYTGMFHVAYFLRQRLRGQRPQTPETKRKISEYDVFLKHFDLCINPILDAQAAAELIEQESGIYTEDELIAELEAPVPDSLAAWRIRLDPLSKYR